MTIKELQKLYDLKAEDFWKHQQSGQWIITHDAVEKIAFQEKIELVERIVDNSEPDLVRYWITMGYYDDEGNHITQSAVGEADRKNCKSQYLGCIASKRGEDRCVLKLIRAYQYGVSSEVEAEDFRKPVTKFYKKIRR